MSMFEIESAVNRMLGLRRIVMGLGLKFLIASWLFFLEMAVIKCDPYLRVWVWIGDLSFATRTGFAF
jgi:hypothetical protein